MRRFWAGLAIAISLAAITAGGVVITQDDGDATAANLHVNTSGGTCTRSSTPIDFATAQSNGWVCTTFDQANDLCQGGDSVRVKTGTYSGQTLRGSNSRSSACQWTFEEDVLVNGRLNFGSWHSGGCTVGNAASHSDWHTLTGPFEVRGFDADCTTRITITGPSRGEGMDLDANGANNGTGGCGGAGTHTMNTSEGATFFTLRNSKIHNAAGGDGHWWSGGSDHLYEYNDIYNLAFNDCDHDEALRVVDLGGR